jgi:hypothetical protein
MAMLNINPETVCFIIAKARQFHAKEEVVITEVPYSSSDDWALQILANHIEDATVRELKATVRDLEPDQQAELIALLWLGRGDYLVSDWEAAKADAASSLIDITDPAAYLLAHPLAADFLMEGLYQQGINCEN